MITTLKLIVIATIPVVCGSLFSILLSYLNEGAGLVIFIFSILISIGSLYINISKYLLNGKSAVLELSLVITVLLIILCIVIGDFASKEIYTFINKLREVINLY